MAARAEYRGRVLSRLWWRVLAYLVLVPVLTAAFLPFTERGSRWLLESAARLLPVELTYGGGTLAGEILLERLVWNGEGLRLALAGLVIELSPNCLWHSRICFSQLYAQDLSLELLAEPATEPVPPQNSDDDSLFEFPVPMEAANLQVDALSVVWQGGQWRQGRIEGAVAISGSTVRVGRALVQDAQLILAEGGDDSPAPGMPRISLPLRLQVEELELQGAALDIDGTRQAFESLRLRGGDWRATRLRLAELSLRSPGLGQWQTGAQIEFAERWPLIAEGTATLPPVAGWPAVLGSELSFSAGGDLRALTVEVRTGGQLSIAASASADTLDPALPFQLSLQADWPQVLALNELVEVPPSLAELGFTAPLQLDVSGGLARQVFQLDATASAPGYGALDVRMAGSHENGRLELEDLRLQDAGGINTLWGRAALDYGETLRWSALLETSGLALQSLSDYGTGYIEGSVQLLGEVAGQEWQLTIAGAQLEGTLNELPARLSGSGGIDSRLRLLPGELKAELNGTRMVLQAEADSSLPGRLDIAIDDLGRWLSGSHGSLSLQASLAPGWEQFNASGSLRDIKWEGLVIGSGRLTGDYRAAGEGRFSLDMTLADLAMSGIELDTTTIRVHGDKSSQVGSIRARGDVEGLLEVRGGMLPQGAWAGHLAATTLQTAAGDWYLAEPVAVDFTPAPARLRLAPHCWQFGQSRLCPGEALLAQEGSASLALDGELTALAGFLPPDLELTGRLAGQFAADWSPGRAVVIDGEVNGRDIVLTRHFGAEESGTMSWQRIEASVHNDGDGLALSTGGYAGESRIIDLALHLPAKRTLPLSGALVVNGMQLGSLAPFVPAMSALEGDLHGELQLEGSLGQPAARGELRLSNGHFALLGNPTELQQFELQLTASGDRAALQGRGLLGGGQLQVSGRVLSEPEWRLELAMEGDHHEILLPPYTQMQVSEQLDLILTGGLLRLTGDIVVHEGTLEHEQLPAGGVTLSDDVVEVDLVGNVIYERAPFDTSMDIGLLIEDNFQILGDMVNAKLGGDLQLRQEPRQPMQVFGNLTVLGGELRAYQQRLRIQRGTVSFAGTPDNPELDVRAQREITGDDVVVGLQLQGTLNQPKLEVFSDPVMSHGESMSYLVRGRGLDSGAGADGVAMALSLGTGLVNQTALMTELNSIPGISNFAFGAEGSTEADTAATVGGYIGERLYLSYGMGIYEPVNVLTARLYLQTRLWLEVVSRLENSVDLYYSFDID